MSRFDRQYGSLPYEHDAPLSPHWGLIGFFAGGAIAWGVILFLAFRWLHG